MALIKCPECGRANVSDTAESCPNCGYGIKAHYEEIEIKKEQEERIKRAKIAEKKKREEAEERERERMQSIPPLEFPRLFGPITTIFISLFLIYICFYNMTSISYEASDTALLLVLICILIGGFYWGYKRIEEYRLSKTNLEEYRKHVIREQDYQAAIQAKVDAEKEAKKAMCPYCHSYNTVKISTATKAINTAAFGILGQKRTYQWHCNNCKSDF